MWYVFHIVGFSSSRFRSIPKFPCWGVEYFVMATIISPVDRQAIISPVDRLRPRVGALKRGLSFFTD